MITTRPVLAQFLRYSTKKNVSNISISFVGWSSISTAISRSSWQATLRRRISERVRRPTFVSRTCSRPNSSIKRFIYKINWIRIVLLHILVLYVSIFNLYLLYISLYLYFVSTNYYLVVILLFICCFTLDFLWYKITVL